LRARTDPGQEVVGRAALQRGQAAGEEIVPPSEEGGGGDAEFARDEFPFFAAEEAEHGCGLAL
jgi:hypothetical protein